MQTAVTGAAGAGPGAAKAPFAVRTLLHLAAGLCLCLSCGATCPAAWTGSAAAGRQFSEVLPHKAASLKHELTWLRSSGCCGDTSRTGGVPPFATGADVDAACPAAGLPRVSPDRAELEPMFESQHLRQRAAVKVTVLAGEGLPAQWTIKLLKYTCNEARQLAHLCHKELVDVLQGVH